MRKVMVEASAKLEQALLAREGEPDLYALFLLEYGAAYSPRWNRRGATVKLSRDHFASCPRCGKRVRRDWKFCGATQQCAAA